MAVSLANRMVMCRSPAKSVAKGRGHGLVNAAPAAYKPIATPRSQRRHSVGSCRAFPASHRSLGNAWGFHNTSRWGPGLPRPSPGRRRPPARTFPQSCLWHCSLSHCARRSIAAQRCAAGTFARCASARMPNSPGSAVRQTAIQIPCRISADHRLGRDEVRGRKPGRRRSVAFHYLHKRFDDD